MREQALGPRPASGVHATTAADLLRRRAAPYAKLWPLAAVAGAIGLVLAIAFWMPWPGAGPAFRHIQIDRHFDTWWNDHQSRVHHAGEAVNLVLYHTACTALGGALILAGVAMRFRRRGRLGTMLIALALLTGNAVPQAIGRRDAPETYADPAEVTPVMAARLDAAVQTPQGQALIYQQIMYPLADGRAISWGSLDDFSVRSIAPEIHYILAQRAYLAGDAAATAVQLDAIDLSHVPVTYGSAYRLNVMRDWAMARGQPVHGWPVHTPLPSIPVAWQRPLSWGGLFVAILSLGVVAAALTLFRTLRRRADRLEGLVARLAVLERRPVTS